MRILPIIVCALLLGLSSEAQTHRRALVRIDSRGNQEVIPLYEPESPDIVLAHCEKNGFAVKPGSVQDSLMVYDQTGTATNTAFSFLHKDVALQWYLPAVSGFVRAFWFQLANNYPIAFKHRAQVRAWTIDPRVLSLPASACSNSSTDTNGNMGYYKCSTDGDGLKTPFRDEATDTAFVKGLAAASVTFDPLGKELPISAAGGVTVDLIAGAWHKVSIPGDSMKFTRGAPFGFTVQNLLEYREIPAGFLDTAMVLAAYSSLGYPYHSIKFYEGTPASNYGWQIRAHEWKWCVVVEYSEAPPPKISLQQLKTTLKTAQRMVTATVRSDDPGGLKTVDLFAKINSGAYVKSAMTGSQPNYTGTLPATNQGDTVSYYAVATDMRDFAQTSPTYSYRIFFPGSRYLCIWNGRALPTGASVGSLAARYMKRDGIDKKQYYDIWDVAAYGTAEMPDVLKNYDVAFEATGDGGYADLTSKAGDWLATGTLTSPKTYLLSDQDHFFVGGGGWDTAFGATEPIYKYFGIQQAAPQDYPYIGTNVTWPWRVTPQDSTDVLTGFIQKWANRTGTTFWYHPNFEWPPFLNWMDELQPTVDAKILFKDGARVVGVRKDAIDNSWHTMFLAFDYLSTDFRSDTSRSLYATPDKDPKYAKITDAGSLVDNAIKAWTSVRWVEGTLPAQFSLSRNYPNPFNPSTTISFDIPVSTHVSIVVYDCLGREVATVVNCRRPAGHYQEKFSAAALGSGVYFYRMMAGEYSAVRKMIVLK